MCRPLPRVNSSSPELAGIKQMLAGDPGKLWIDEHQLR
jgi:hypothetical protein